MKTLPTTIQRIAILPALQLGDMLWAVSALRALRSAWPQAHIALIGLPWAQAFMHRYADLIDELILFPGAIGFSEQKETNEELPAFYALARTRGFDLAIQMHGSGGPAPANDIVAQLGAHTLAGFLQTNEPTYAGYFIRWPNALNALNALPEPERYIALMQCIGIPAETTPLDFPIFDEDHRHYTSLVTRCALKAQRLICIHASAQLPSRRWPWPLERFAAVADALANDGWQIAITRTANEHPIACAMRTAMATATATATSAINLTGKTSIGALAALIANAKLIICNDTSVSHIAAAIHTASVVIACGSDTHRWAPLDYQLHRVLANWPACRPCTFAICPPGHECALNISANGVIVAACAQAQLQRYAYSYSYSYSHRHQGGGCVCHAD